MLDSLAEFCSVAALVAALEQPPQPSQPASATSNRSGTSSNSTTAATTTTSGASSSSGSSLLAAASPLQLSALGEQLRAELVALASDDAELLLADEAESDSVASAKSESTSAVYEYSRAIYAPVFYYSPIVQNVTACIQYSITLS